MGLAKFRLYFPSLTCVRLFYTEYHLGLAQDHARLDVVEPCCEPKQRALRPRTQARLLDLGTERGPESKGSQVGRSSPSPVPTLSGLHFPAPFAEEAGLILAGD